MTAVCWGWRSDDNEFGGLLGELVAGGVVVGVAFDRDDEGGELAVADDPPELLLRDEHPGGGPALAHVAVTGPRSSVHSQLQLLTVTKIVLDVELGDATGSA